MQKMNRVTTKKEISKVLGSLDSTQIFKLAKKLGIDVDSKSNVYDFIKENAPNTKVRSKAHVLSYQAGSYKHYRCYRSASEFDTNIWWKERISNAIRFAKRQKKDGDWGPYSKILFIGFNNIYWCSPVFGHTDYNKSIAFPNNEKNRYVAKVINKFLGYELR